MHRCSVSVPQSVNAVVPDMAASSLGCLIRACKASVMSAGGASMQALLCVMPARRLAFPGRDFDIGQHTGPPGFIATQRRYVELRYVILPDSNVD